MAPALPQSEIAGNEEHYCHKTNNVENIVHVSSPFFKLIGLLSFGHEFILTGEESAVQYWTVLKK